MSGKTFRQSFANGELTPKMLRGEWIDQAVKMAAMSFAQLTPTKITLSIWESGGLKENHISWIRAYFRQTGRLLPLASALMNYLPTNSSCACPLCGNPSVYLRPDGERR